MSVSYYRGNEVPEMNYNITVDAELQEKSVTIKNNGTTVISPDGNYNALSEVTVNVNIEAKADPILQSKTIDITENGNTIVSPDSGYDGLSEVSVNVTVASSGGESSEKEDPEIQTLIETAGNENNFYTSPKGGNLRNTYLLTGDYVLSGLWSYWYYDTETQEYKPQRTPDGRDYFAPYYDAWALEKIRNSGYSLTIYHDNKYYPFSEFLGKPIFRDGSSYISSSNDYYQDFDGEWRDYEYFYWWGYDLAYRDSWGSEYIIENPYDYGSYSLKPTVKPGGYFVWYEPVERSITDKLDTYYSSKEIKNFKGGIVPWHFSLGNSNISDCGGVTDGILTVNIGTASSYYDGSTDFSGIGFLLLRKDGVYYNAEDVVWNLASSQKIYYKGIGKIKEVKININNLASRFKDFKNLKKIE